MSSQDLKITSFTPKQPTPKPTTNPQQEPTQERNQNPTTTHEEQPIQKLKQTPAKTLTLTPKTGSLFTAPPNHLLIHACNTVGSWGAGIASTFRTMYPKAYKCYREYCLVAHDPLTNPVPTGTCLLIPPCETRPGAPKHWIGCLFTSKRYGKKRDPPAEILRNTGPAVRALLREVKERGSVEGVRMCKINSGLFAVEWEKTATTLEDIVLEDGWKDNIEVWSMDE